ncbi:MAG: L-Ala-D/L-Glu epimerase [Solirubrobacterales bacterium]|nr:L-Ala-D/L-Glu epimerase [Solirubrobacterales bacterium]
MTLVSAETVPYALPFREPYVTARGSLSRREMVLFRLRSSEGVAGLGEAVPLSLRGGTGIDEVASQLSELGEALVEAGAWSPPAGDGRTRLHAAMAALSAPAACAAVTARLDLESRERDLPAWRALGALSAEPVTCNATLGAGSPSETARQAALWAADGFQTMKLKVGLGEEEATVAAVRAQLGDEPRIRLDANAVWDLEEAGRALAACEPHRIELVEQPVAGLAEMTRLRHMTAIPIAADESVCSAADAERAVELEACDLATVKLSKVGGHLDAVGIAEQLPVYLSSALDGPVGIAAAAHVAQQLRQSRLDAGVAHGLATQRLFSETIASVECELRGDRLHLPQGPGLGVEIDEAALARQRL